MTVSERNNKTSWIWFRWTWTLFLNTLSCIDYICSCSVRCCTGMISDNYSLPLYCILWDKMFKANVRWPSLSVHCTHSTLYLFIVSNLLKAWCLDSKASGSDYFKKANYKMGLKCWQYWPTEDPAFLKLWDWAFLWPWPHPFYCTEH